jgi:hypothetical protein
MFTNIRARFGAQKFNIYTEAIDPKRKGDNFLAGEWISKTGILYYGHPWFIFFKSAHNDWYHAAQSNNQ